jgi:hypothetical protein
MDIDVIRYNSTANFTDGLLFINGGFMVHTLEDEEREIKVKHETRIPNGKYKVTLRTEGGFHQRYLNQYGSDFHKGMLWVRDVPNFEYILIHKGNTEKHTSGCLLVGMGNNADNKDFISHSADAYELIYPIISKAILRGEDVWIHYKEINLM